MDDESRTEFWSENPDLTETDASCPVQLIVIEGDPRGYVFDVREPDVRIGRRSDNELVLASSKVSKAHARIFQELDDYFIEDLESTNKTFINGVEAEPHKRHPLCHGDSIRLGDQLLMFRQAASFVDAHGASTIQFDKEKVRREVEAVLRDLPLTGSDS